MDVQEMLLQIRARQKTGASDTTTKTFDCPDCEDRGYLLWRDHETGELMSRECPCAVRKRNLRRLERSGLSSLATLYTFERFQTEEPWQQRIKNAAETYLSESKDRWFVISGPPGTGKTHICTAIVSRLIQGGKEVRYMLWREEAPRLKALVNERAQYDPAVREWKGVDVLYIDDFFKAPKRGNGNSVTDGDVNLAFELLNSRYNRQLPTLISTELSIQDILEIDEGIGSRIYERGKGFLLKTAQNRNWRLKK